jgi:hypothetical protein
MRIVNWYLYAYASPPRRCSSGLRLSKTDDTAGPRVARAAGRLDDPAVPPVQHRDRGLLRDRPRSARFGAAVSQDSPTRSGVVFGMIMLAAGIYVAPRLGAAVALIAVTTFKCFARPELAGGLIAWHRSSAPRSAVARRPALQNTCSPNRRPRERASASLSSPV